MNSDERLMQEFQQGSKEAFREIFGRYRDRMWGFFRRRLDHPSRAEELTQECFLALLRNAARYEPRASFRSYLYGIATNMLAAERRKTGREICSEEEKRPEAADLSQGDPDSALWVREALDRLGKMDREVLMLREYEQLSYEEIATLLQLPVNTVRSRLFRARMALREQLLRVNQANRGVQ